MALDRRTALTVAAEGHRAAAAGQSPRDCPYNANGGPEDRFRAHVWKRGFQAAKRAAQDSTGR